jgi:orotidine-5'-phosphate decarboxylase
VSKGISAATKERITTGRINAVTEQFKAADTLAGRLYEAAKRGAVGAVVGTVATPFLGPGVGAALASALTRGAKTASGKAIDALIVSPEFARAVSQTSKPAQAAAVTRLAYSNPRQTLWT